MANPQAAAAPSAREWTLTALCVGLIVACWIMATPRNAGPDEPSHAVATAALVRGDIRGTPQNFGYPTEEFQVPAMVGEPNPACFAFDPDTTADCAGNPDGSTADAPRYSTSAGYPVWGHVLPGLASFVPSAQWYAYVARALNAVLAVALVTAALRRVRSQGSLWAVALLVGVTPIAWHSMSIISPSAIAIAGGLALWAALLTPRATRTDTMLVCAWLAILLPRRDGPLWATLIVLTVCAATACPPRDLWQRLSRRQQVLVAVSLLLPLLPFIRNGASAFNVALALAPLALPVVDVVLQRRWLHRVPATPLTVAVAWSAVVATALSATMVLRPGGADLTHLTTVVNTSGEHLRQVVGVLGWLDAPVPTVAIVGWWVLVGVLLGAGLAWNGRVAGVAALALATTIVVAWILELGTGDMSGTYWQGRYSMPFVSGFGVLLISGVRPSPELDRRLRAVVAVSLWLLWNVSFAQALRRWEVGLRGTMFPWRWDADTTPGPALLWLVLHAAASAWLLSTVAAHRRQAALG